MGEPLNRSFLGKTIHPNFTKEDKSTYCLNKDIESALKWLDKSIDKIAPRHKPDYTSLTELRKSQWKLCNCKTCSKIKKIKELIKQAFPNLNSQSNEKTEEKK